MDLYVYNPTLIILGHGRFVRFFTIKCVDNRLLSPVLTVLGSKRKMSELSGRECSHILIKKNSTVS